MNKIHVREGHLRLGPVRVHGALCDSDHTCVPATAYLAGPMRGLPYWNFPAFQDAAQQLQVNGWAIHSPAEHDLAMGLIPVEDGTVDFPVSACLDWDFKKIAESSCVITLPGWETSTGCHWELTVAHALGKAVFQYPELTPVELPEVVTQPVAVQRAHVPQAVWDARMAAASGPPPDYAHMRGVNGPGAWSRTAERSGASAEGVQRVATLAGEVRVVDPETGGAKGSKPERFDLIPADVMEELARHYGRGCQKYADRNWERGYKWSLSVAALERHLNLWKQGQDIDHDPEIGDFPHLVAVIWHACALLAFGKRGIGMDDRA